MALHTVSFVEIQTNAPTLYCPPAYTDFSLNQIPSVRFIRMGIGVDIGQDERYKNTNTINARV
jgi:hypothetical protein